MSEWEHSDIIIAGGIREREVQWAGRGVFPETSVTYEILIYGPSTFQFLVRLPLQLTCLYGFQGHEY